MLGLRIVEEKESLELCTFESTESCYDFGKTGGRCQEVPGANLKIRSGGEPEKSGADRYAKVVYWSEEDQCFIGCCSRLIIGGCHGDDPKAVFAELCDIVGEAVALYLKDGRPLPSPDTHYDLASHKQSMTTT